MLSIHWALCSIVLNVCVEAGEIMEHIPRGWFSGQRYKCNTDCLNYPNDCISAKLVSMQVAAIKSLELPDLGYKYVLLDDAWMAATRDSQGQLQTDPSRFPGGLRNLSDMVHAAGLKFGVYISLGNTTGCGMPGTLGHKEQDAATLASWGVDMVYADAANLAKDPQTLNQAYQDIAYYLNKSGRTFLLHCMLPYNLEKIGSKIDWLLVIRTCQMFRVYDDMIDSWESLHDVIKHFGDSGSQYYNYSGPGHRLDPGQLLVGDFGLSENQQELQYAVWTVMGAPLWISADLTSLSAPAKALLTNKMAATVCSNSSGTMGLQKAVIGQVRIWLRHVNPAGSFCLALLYENISGGPSKVSLKLTDLGMTTAAAYNFTDVFSGENLGLYKPWYTLNTEVNPTGVKFFYAEARNFTQFEL